MATTAYVAPNFHLLPPDSSQYATDTKRGSLNIKYATRNSFSICATHFSLKP
jgi:hypothetical protein